jgi:hypothetical protein
MSKSEELMKYSDPSEVYKNAIRYGLKPKYFDISTKKNKKYMVYNKEKKKWIHFGQFSPPMEDYTYHKNEERRLSYLRRASKLPGNWRDDRLSANNLAMFLLWT